MITIFLCILVAILMSGFFSGTEISFFSLSQMRVRSLIKQGNKNALLVARLKANPDRLLTTILIGNNLVNIGSSALMTYLMTQQFGSEGVGIATGIMTLAILTFGEIIPKSIATRYAQPIALNSARIFVFLQCILFPFVWIFEQISKVPRLILKGGGADHLITDEDVASMAAISFDQGGLLNYERDTITNILKLNDTVVSQVMTKKSDMIMVRADDTLTEMVHSIRQQHFSRVPIYDPITDRVTGFIFIHDILNYPRNQWSKVTATDLSRKPLEAHETDSLHKVYQDLLNNRTHLVVVYNQKDELVGMVTLEDVVEEVLGEINDETDYE